jgi:uncharacterized protein (DUF433 family)
MATATGRIFKQADRQGGDACVHGTRIPVWVLDNCRRLGMPDAQILSTYPSLTPPDLEAAWDYVAANREEIEQAIRETKRATTAPWSNGGCCSTRTRTSLFPRSRNFEYRVTTC